MVGAGATRERRHPTYLIAELVGVVEDLVHRLRDAEHAFDDLRVLVDLTSSVYGIVEVRSV